MDRRRTGFPAALSGCQGPIELGQQRAQLGLRGAPYLRSGPDYDRALALLTRCSRCVDPQRRPQSSRSSLKQRSKHFRWHRRRAGRLPSCQQLSMLSMLHDCQIHRRCWAHCPRRDHSSSSSLCLCCYTKLSHSFTHSHQDPVLCHGIVGYILQNVVYEPPLSTRHLQVDPSQGTQV